MTHAAQAEPITFMAAAGTRACVWPMRGSGADMLVCGADREPGCPYCRTHNLVSMSAESRARAKRV